MPVKNKFPEEKWDSRSANYSGSGQEQRLCAKATHLVGLVAAAKKILTPFRWKLLDLWNEASHGTR